jgi:hypothetical protein
MDDRFAWKKDNIIIRDINMSTKSINSNSVNGSEDRAFLLFDTYFYSPDELIHINSKKIEAKTYVLNPLFPSVTEQIVNSVYTAKLERGSIILGDGFYKVEDLENKSLRWMKDDSTLDLYSDANLNATLNMKFMSFHRARTLCIYVNGDTISSNVIPTSFVNVKVPVSLKKG